ncbi:MAG: HemK/PrmC family methyltransferase [Coriobacteriia bacterium]|nr:HemK/PrmC family methyltransferase [Coriobacteriia bacterium]
MAGDTTWTIRSMLEWCSGYLGRHGDEAPRRSAEVLVGKACGLERIELYLDMDRPLSAGELDVLREDVRRRGQGMPLQYITGTAPFRYLEVEVAPGVLIPRPETEVLVSEALAMLPPAPKPQDSYDRVLLAELRRESEGEGEGESPAEEAAAEEPELLVADICTGSGCIACSIATEHPLTRVVATDIAPEAIALARKNAARFDVADRVEVLEGDLGACIDPEFMGSFDLVVSNPPYVPTAVLSEIPREVADYEPALALDGGADGLDLFRRLATWSLQALKPGGGFACELHETCLDAAADIARDAGFTEIRIVNDLTNRPRVLVAKRP